jgi:hypothetical protein
MEIRNASTHKEVVRAKAYIQRMKGLIAGRLEHNQQHIRKIAKELEDTYYLAQIAKIAKPIEARDMIFPN